MKPYKLLTTVLLAAFTVSPASSKDLGVQGNIWEIVERDMRQLVMESAARVDWDKVNNELADRSKRYIDELPIRRMPTAQQTEVVWIDPSITLESEIQAPVKQPDGSWKWQVLYPKGHKYNPLDDSRPLTAMLFIDSSDEDQLRLAKEMLVVEPMRIQVVEAGQGSVRKGTEAIGRPLFYANDQLLNRFQVTRLPSMLFANERMNRGRLGLLSFAKPFDIQAARIWDGIAPALAKNTNEKTAK